ncbi:hypothetical protein ACHAWU_009607 [Discostella pseudostelligera]|uniref:Uncharacterized protein n=1 Tax=Discostella pseudostelligera TaxID=259834 RepID=A0ABD3MDG4_9STRA
MANQLHDRRWRPVNALKNSSVTIQIVCSWSGKRFTVPSNTKQFIASSNNDDNSITFDNDNHEADITTSAASEELLGSTTLLDLIKRVKKNIPGMYLMDEVGGGVLVCGPNHVFQNEWDTTMICDLILDNSKTRASSSSIASDENGEPKEIPRVVLEDGTEAVVITIGTPESVLQTKPTVVQRCLAKGDVYG